MLLATLARPLLGAAIGYCTNYIAVKMLFHPLKPVMLFGHRLPFTPGVIPKGQARLAHAAGQVVGAQLLTPEAMEQTLLSEEAKETVRRAAAAWADEHGQMQFGALAQQQLGAEKYQALRENIDSDAIDYIMEELQTVNLGSLVAQQVLTAVREKVGGSLLSMVLSDEMLQSFASPVEQKVNDYFAANGEQLILPAVCGGMDRLEQKTVEDGLRYLSENGTELPQLAVSLYETVVTGYLPQLLQTMDFSGIVERQINALSPKELEMLVLSVMKKELSAVVNLGALVGFVLGLLNLLW